MILTRREKTEGEMLPPFYYGYSHRDYRRDVIYFYPVPLNFIIRLFIPLKFHWDVFRSHPSRLDIQIHEGIRAKLMPFMTFFMEKAYSKDLEKCSEYVPRDDIAAP